MDADAAGLETLVETTVFLYYFKDMLDYRQAGKVTYPLDEILLLCLLSVLVRHTPPHGAQRHGQGG